MIDNTKEYILCAAIQYDDGIHHPDQDKYEIKTGFVRIGYRHHDIIREIPTNPVRFRELYGTDMQDIQGFLTSKCRFVDRKEAARIAFRCGQIEQLDANTRLFSEDLY